MQLHSASVLQAIHNPAYGQAAEKLSLASELAQQAVHASLDTAQAAIVNKSVADSTKQPWQLAAMQTAAEFDSDTAATADRYLQAAALLSGMLHPNVSERITAIQLVELQCFSDRRITDLQQCPDLIQRLL